MAKSVVIVDDSMFQTQQLSRFFKDVLGFEVLATGENGEEAVELFRKHKPDLITMDLTMPKLDGRGALIRILEEFPEANILVVSAVKGPLLLDCLSQGAKSYVEKPLRFDKDEFVRDFKASVQEILILPELKGSQQTTMDAGNSNFFLINLDGSVTPAAAMAGLASGGPPVDRLSLSEALGLTPEQVAQFKSWLALVQRRHRDLRWEKLATLAPVLEIGAGRGDDESHLRLLYRKLEDRDGNLTAVLVIGIDAGPTRAMIRQLEEERLRHKLEIRDVLALSANPPETLGAFLADSEARLEAARKEWDVFLAAQKPDAANETAHDVHGIHDVWQIKGAAGESAGQRLFRELHMIKGNAGAFGFDGLASSTQEAENLLEALRNPIPGSERIAARLTAALTDLRTQLDEIRRALSLIAGQGQDAMARILKWKMDRLMIAASEVDPARLDPQLRSLVDATRRLPFLSPAYLARKYQNLVERLAMNLGKQVQFRVTGNTGDVHPECFSRVDEALVHIFRNLVDHGIETPEERAAAGKGMAEIGMEYVTGEDRIFLRIRDDGRGMDPDKIADRGVALGLLTRAEADALDDVSKLGLIFKERFTTRREADQISGRGLGLALAARCVADRGGNLYVYSRPGEGTRFAIELPHLGQKKLP